MILTALCLTFVVFFLTNLYPNLEKLAKTQGNARMTDAEVASWLDRNGYGGPMIMRYGQWLGVVPGWTREDDETGGSPGAASTGHGPGRRASLLRADAGGPWAIPPSPMTRWPISSAAACNSPAS
jgi:peptide/nickel transport system permease protein